MFRNSWSPLALLIASRFVEEGMSPFLSSYLIAYSPRRNGEFHPFLCIITTGDDQGQLEGRMIFRAYMSFASCSVFSLRVMGRRFGGCLIGLAAPVSIR